MNRNQFWVLFIGSLLVVTLLLLQVIFSRQAQYGQARMIAAQQVVGDGRNCENLLSKLATRIYQLGQQTQDQGLRDILVRQQITINTTPAPAANGVQPIAPAPSTR